MALEWKHSVDSKDGDVWAAGKWEINVGADGAFFVYVRGDMVSDGHHTLVDAQDWCESQESAAAPALPLPEVGSVWVVPYKPETRRFVVQCLSTGDDFGISYAIGGGLGNVVSFSDWHSWVRETRAIDLLADREALVRRAETAEHQRNLWEQDSRSKAKEVDAWKRRTEVAEARGNEMLAKAAQLRDECDKACKRAEAAEAKERMESQRNELTTTLRIAQNAVNEIAKERDELRAAKEHLLSVLRRICEYRELLDSASRDVYGQIGDIETMAREAVNKEGGGNG